MRLIGVRQFLFVCAAVCIPCTFAIAQSLDDFAEFFQSHSLPDWKIAHYDFSHPKFDTDWRREQVAFDNGMSLSLSPKTKNENQFDGASIRRKRKTHFGRYEVTIQPARGEGIVTGFFTYSGPYYGTRHDEIDIEFLGKDTTQIHLAWFVDGKLRNKFINLGFDAADRPRTYAFDWRPDRLTWYAEDKLIFEHTISDGPIPQVPGYLFANLWAADPIISSWSGVANPRQSFTAHVRHIAYSESAPERGGRAFQFAPQ